MRSLVRYRNQGGFSLVECLVAIALMGIMLAGVMAATVTSTKGAGTNSTTQRINVLLTAFGEALKRLDYIDCGTATEYQHEFDSGEALLSQQAQLIQDDLKATLSITGITIKPTGICDTAVDPGTQTFAIAATYNGKQRTGTVVKRDPDPKSLRPQGVIRTSGEPPCTDVNNPCLSTPGDAQFAYSLSARDIFVPGGVIRYEWNCDTSVIPAVIITTTTYDAPEGVCVYNAPVGANVNKTISLTVYPITAAVTTFTKTVVVPGTPAAHPNPVAAITVDTAGPYNTTTNISFRSTGPAPLDASIVKWQWDFADDAAGTSPVMVGSVLNTPRTVTCTSDTPACTTQPHIFTVAGTYTVSLTVTDNFGATGTSTATVTVTALGLPKPTASFTMTPSSGVARQRVQFNGTASHASGSPAGVGITNYFWEVGDGVNTLSGATPVFDYLGPGTYTITLTVTATNGQTNSTTRTLTLTELLPPSATLFVLTSTRFDIPIIRNGRMDFKWINVPRSAGDTVTVELQISSLSFICENFFSTINRSIPAGAAGTEQTIRIQPDSGFFDGFNGLCVGSTMRYEVKTKRVSSTGVVTFSNTSTGEFEMRDWDLGG